MSATSAVPLPKEAARPMSAGEKKVILASSLGTVFEWYDFYLYGSLAAIIGAQFFSAYPEATRNIFALMAFAAGFLVRPFGALVFGRLGDLVGPQVHLPRDHPDHGHLDLRGRPSAILRHDERVRRRLGRARGAAGSAHAPGSRPRR